MSAFYADDSGGPPMDPAFAKAQFDHVEYPKILRKARELNIYLRWRAEIEGETHVSE